MACTRALLTETEQKYIAGGTTDQRKYKAISVVRRRMKDALTQDIELLEEKHVELSEELRETVCKDNE